MTPTRHVVVLLGTLKGFEHFTLAGQPSCRAMPPSMTAMRLHPPQTEITLSAYVSLQLQAPFMYICRSRSSTS
jgi:hypothetical protein